MKEIKQTVVINQSAQFVFSFTLNPENTPKWIDRIVKEQTSETPAKLGTVYRNQDQEGNWNEYAITAYELGVMFVLSRTDGSYHVKYTFTPLYESRCEVEYCEWGDSGDLDESFVQQILKKLKDVLEQK